MQTTFRLFPWDIEGDPDAAARLRAEGVERVALAATYHGARTITPRHPHRRIVDLPVSASYLREAGPLPGGRFSFETARQQLERAGVRVDAWAVVGHLDGGPSGVPRVENAFGERMPHAPCLSHASSRSFLRAVVETVARASGRATVHLEAVGWQGLAHGSLHDKLHGADLGPTAAELLGSCVCSACADGAGVDRHELVAAVRTAIDRELDDEAATAGEAGEAAEAADGRVGAADDVITALRRHRAGLAAGIARELVDVAFAAGAAAVGIAADEAEALHRDPRVERLVDCWGDVERGLGALDRAGGGGTAYVDLLSSDPDGFAEHWAALAAAGAENLHAYHAGLASTRRLRAAVAAARGIR